MGAQVGAQLVTKCTVGKLVPKGQLQHRVLEDNKPFREFQWDESSNRI